MAKECALVVEEEAAFSDLYLTEVEFPGEVEGRELSRGSYGVVYEVMWRGTVCAAKKIHPTLLESVPGGANSVIRGFIKECSMWSRLRHPHVAQFLGLYRTSRDQLPLLVTEKMETSLSQLLQTYSRETFHLPHKVSILHQVALGLTYLHGTTPPTAHRELSANNILVNTTALTAKITDFGFTKLMDLVRTHSHTMMPGTHAYMAPEAELGSSCDYTEKVDIFAFGVLIIHTLTHQMPVPGPRMNENGQVIAVGEYKRREHHLTVCNDIEVELLYEPIRSCLMFNPDDRIVPTSLIQRFQTVQEVVGVPIIGNVPQSKDGNELKDKLLHAEMRMKEERCLMQEKVTALESKNQELQHKLDGIPVTIREEGAVVATQPCAGGQMLTLKQLQWSMRQDQYQSRMTSSNALHFGENAYVGISYNSGQPSIYKITGSYHHIYRSCLAQPQIQAIAHVLPWSVERFALAAFKGSLLVVGGKYVSGAKPAGMGEYSNKIFSLSPEGGAAELTLPPMRSACASPAVVTHEGLIIVVHGEGADSGVEVLDTTSPNPDWKQVEPLPYFSATPFATIASSYLVVWIGAIYSMHLSCITTGRRNTHQLSSNWMALPSPPESISLQLTSYGGQLAAFAIAKDRQVLGYQFDQSHREWIKCCQLDTVSTELPYQPSIRVSTSATLVAVMWDTMEGQDVDQSLRFIPVNHHRPFALPGYQRRPILRLCTGTAPQPSEYAQPRRAINLTPL